MTKVTTEEKRSRGPARPYPNISVREAGRIAEALRDFNASKPMNRLLLADALKAKASSSVFRDLIAGSAKYGFTKGNFNAEQIALMPRGVRLISNSAEQRLGALREAIRAIPAFERALTFFDQHKLPAREHLVKTVQQNPIGISAAWAEEFSDVFVAAGREVGFIREISGSPHVLLDAGAPPSISDEGVPPAAASDTEELRPHEGEAEASALHAPSRENLAPTKDVTGSRRLQFFVAHGSNHKPLEQLKQILNQFGIPFVVAQDEPHAGRPISQKVKELMDDCTAGIFIFSADEAFFDQDGNEIWRPRENVIFELGAASYLYGRRIVIFKEDGVTFPSDFSDLGWIEFARDSLDAKAMELMKELIGLGALKLVAGAS